MTTVPPKTSIDPDSKPLRSSLEPVPIIEFCGLKVHIQRNGTSVTGRAKFPYFVQSRDVVPIDYRCHVVAMQTPVSTPTDERGAMRVQAVQRWRHFIHCYPMHPRAEIARRVIQESDLGITVRTLQLWTKKLDEQGPSALSNRYVRPIPGTPVFDPVHEHDALLVCAWWCFRIGNAKAIDTKMMAAAVTLAKQEYKVADLLATVDCYYSYDTPRDRYPFKRFSKWVRYDVDKWMFRAADDADYRRGCAQARHESERLLPPIRSGVPPSAIPDPKTRRREALSHRSTTAIRDLAQPIEASPSSGNGPSATQRIATGKMLDGLGCKSAARQVVGSIDSGVVSLSANEQPTTIAQSLGRLDDAWRSVLLRATGPDHDAEARAARAEAVATLPLWWEAMPQSVRNNIDFRVDHWSREHPSAGPDEADRRRFLMLLPALRKRSGMPRIGVAARSA